MSALSTANAATAASSSSQAGPSSTTTVPAVAHPSPAAVGRSRRRHYLFGYPISHSASPAFQNAIVRFLEEVRHGQSEAMINGIDTTPTYSLCETQSLDEAHFRDLVRYDARHGGSGVTMPLKVAVASKLGREHILDELDDIGRATMTVNTIVVLPAKDGDTSLERRRTVGTNTDCLGIRHALLRDVAQMRGLEAGSLVGETDTEGPYVFPAVASSSSFAGSKPLPHSGLIIGSGGTCRSAVWAMHNLGLSPLYLLNRDESETRDVVSHFATTDSSIDLRPLHSLEAYAREQRLRESGEVGPLAAAVGAIPAFDPVTPGEKMVYTLAHAFFREPYRALAIANANAGQAPVPSAIHAARSPQQPSVRTFGLPPKRPFLDMCYKPRLTPLLHFAGTQTTTWSPIGGVEAMVEQGLAQARMWAASEGVLQGKPPTDNPLRYSSRQGDDGPLGFACEEQARKLVQAMTDVVPGAAPAAPSHATSAAPVANAATDVVLAQVAQKTTNTTHALQAQSVH